MPIAVIVMPDSRIRCARVTNSEPIVLPTVGLPSVRSRIRFTVPGSLEARRAWLKADDSPSYIAVRPLTEMAFTAAATSREFPTCVMGSWTVTVSENDTMEIWSVGRSCRMRASAAAFACSIFSPSIDPLESIAREMLRTRPAITAADGVKSTATYTDVPEFGYIRVRCGGLDPVRGRNRRTRPKHLPRDRFERVDGRREDRTGESGGARPHPTAPTDRPDFNRVILGHRHGPAAHDAGRKLPRGRRGRESHLGQRPDRDVRRTVVRLQPGAAGLSGTRDRESSPAPDRRQSHRRQDDRLGVRDPRTADSRIWHHDHRDRNWNRLQRAIAGEDC